MSTPDAWRTTIASAGAADPTVTIGTPSGDPQRLLQATAALDPAALEELELGVELARGGIGSIHLARQRSLEREVAVKRLLGEDPAARVGFATEVVITAGLEHPGVVPVHLAGDGFMAMKRIRGRSLDRLIAEAGGDGIETLVEHLVELTHCLAYAHDRGIVHRDLKPANVMVGGYGEVYLIDWGLALATDDGPAGIPRIAEADNLCAGSPAYLAPEVARGERAAIGPATDCFGLGAILFEILTGAPPVAADSLAAAVAAAAAARWRPIPDAVRTAHGGLVAICERLMDPDPARRLSPTELRTRLEDWIARSARRRAARAELERARSARDRARAATEPTTIFAQLELARDACRLATDLDPERRDALELGDAVQAEAVAGALEAGDLGLAAALATELPQASRQRLAPTIERARRRANRRQRLTRASGWLLAACILALAVLGITQVAWQHRDHLAHQERRRAEAAALVAGLPPPPGTAPRGHSAAAVRLNRALGTHPEPEALQPLVRACALAAARDAIERQDLERAERELRRLGPASADRAQGELRARLERARAEREARLAATRERRQMELEAALERLALAGEDRGELEAEVERLHAWCAGEDGAWYAALVRELLTRPRASTRRLAIAAIVTWHRRAGDPDLLPATLIADMVGDASDTVAAAAASGIAAIDGQADALAVAQSLLAVPDAHAREPLLLAARPWLERHLGARIEVVRAGADSPARDAVLKHWASLCSDVGWNSKAQDLRSEVGQELSVWHQELYAANRSRRLDEIERTARRLIDSHGCPSAYHFLTQAWYRAGRHQDIVELLEPVAVGQGYPDLLGLLARSQLALDHREAAGATLVHGVRAAEQGRILRGDGVEALIDVAFDLDQQDAALRIARSQARREADDSRARYILAWALERCGHHAEAITVCDLALTRWQRQKGFYEVKADALVALGRGEEAAATLRLALEHHADNDRLLYRHGKVMMALGQEREGLRSLLEAADRPGSPRYMNAQAENLARRLGYEGSVVELRLGQARHRSDDPFRRRYLIQALLEHGAGGLAVAELDGFPDDGVERRRVFNRMCYASAALRREGWPTIEPRELADWCLWDGIVLLQLPRPLDATTIAVGRRFLADARRHLVDESQHRALTLLDAWYDGRADAARAAAEAVLAAASGESWHTRFARAALSVLDAAPAPSLPATLPLWEDWLLDVPPPDAVYAPEDRARLRAWFLEHRASMDAAEVDPAFLDALETPGRRRDPPSVRELVLELPHLDRGVDRP